MKAVTVLSMEDGGGGRCVDIRRHGGGTFSFVECRRDPEDGHGWRPLGTERGGFDSPAEAIDAARAAVDWLGDDR